MDEQLTNEDLLRLIRALTCRVSLLEGMVAKLSKVKDAK